MFFDKFHPVSKAWFEEKFGQPTAAQQEAWPAIQQGRNTLIAAPTGSGKTLAAFYVSIDRLVQKAISGTLEKRTQIIYVSPLKALSNDIHRNLEEPLAGIFEKLESQGMAKIEISVAVRTGDTSQYERQQMLKHPPHILVTTPESLYLMLTSKGGRDLLRHADTLIVDEIHALLGDKRGAHLALSVERLEHLTGRPLQRIGLSATQKPITEVVKYLVGRRHIKNGVTDCVIIDGGHKKELDVRLEVPGSPLTALMSNEVWEELYERLVELVESHKTTLIFVNTRRLAERLALSLGERIGEDVISSHHGSMSKEHRHSAEQRLKNGQLRVLVATASMELGIDIGSVNLVVQFSSPKSISAFLQRVGRSGHQVGGIPKGILFPLTRDDLVECSALLDSVRRGELDKLCIPDKPMDILSQHIVAEAGACENEDAGLALDALYTLFSQAWSYRDLQRQEFDQIVQMLGDGYTSRRGRSGALLHVDRINGRARPRKAARLTALTNGGAIPDMFEYQVVLDPEDIVVGSVNEDFALESLPGNIFTLGHHSWRMLRIDGLNIRVADASGQPPTIPFWIGEGGGRSQELSESVSRLRLTIREFIDDSVSAAEDFLVKEIGLQLSAAQQIVQYLKTGSDALNVMPSRQAIVMERFFDEVGDMHLVIHSPFGSRMNRAWGLALRKRFCRSFNFELQAAANEDSIVISLGPVHSFEVADVFHYLNSSTVREVLVQALLDAPMFESRWRWNATRALAIQRNRNGSRVPPQFQRMNAEDLIAQVFPDQLACQENLTGKRQIPDHPLVQQTIHDCLTEAMDLDELISLLKAIEENELELVARDLREPSPFAQEIINARPYAFLDDAPFEERRTNAIRNRSWLDPAESDDYSSLDMDAISRVKEEAWPWIRSVDELHDALMILGFMSDAEMSQGPDGENYRVYLEPLLQSGRVTLACHGESRLWIAAERLTWFEALELPLTYEPALIKAQLPELAEVSREAALTEITRGRLEGLGPVTAIRLARDIGLPVSDIEFALNGLQNEGFVFKGRYTPLVPGAAPVESELGALGVLEEEWCERRLLQRIHRYSIDAHRESIKPVSLQAYMEFLFQHHEVRNLAEEEALPVPATHESLLRVLKKLDGISAPASAWESDILPSRLASYDPALLDMLCLSGRVSWGKFITSSQTQKAQSRLDKQGKPSGPKAGPIKSTPVNLIQRDKLSLWTALTRHFTESEPVMSSDAREIRDVLTGSGASFFLDIVRETGLIKSRAENGLAELVSLGVVTSDSFSGMRALLSGTRKKNNKGRSGKRRRSLYEIEDAGRWALINKALSVTEENQEQEDKNLEALIDIYLQRWGVLSRKSLEKENQAPPWRLLLLKLRRMELQGKVRGGRFIAGIGGEQFALQETVKGLRQCATELKEKAEDKVSRRVINASDPLNLVGIILPGRKISSLAKNRILFENGLPVAVLEKDEINLLRPCLQEELSLYRQTLQNREYPTRLRAYLG
ncbi:MAG: DEAD/DEAH box helicase [Gammaproteobacteria bacterium]|nr:DEAD/DEAH box helicase [Gammaproteobacteria bacterium]